MEKKKTNFAHLQWVTCSASLNSDILSGKDMPENDCKCYKNVMAKWQYLGETAHTDVHA